MFTPYFTSKQLNCIPVSSKSKFKSRLIFERQVSYYRGRKAGGSEVKASNKKDTSLGRGKNDLCVKLNGKTQFRRELFFLLIINPKTYRGLYELVLKSELE